MDRILRVSPVGPKNIGLLNAKNGPAVNRAVRVALLVRRFGDCSPRHLPGYRAAATSGEGTSTDVGTIPPSMA